MDNSATIAARAASESLRKLTPEQGISLWVDVMDACEQFLLAGLRRKIGPRGDLTAAYRDWYARQMEAHDEMMLRMMQAFSRRSGDDGR